MNRRRRYKKPPPKPGRVEVTLLWKDGFRCQATVPTGAPPEVTCGSARFMRTTSIDTRNSTVVYAEVRA